MIRVFSIFSILLTISGFVFPQNNFSEIRENAEDIDGLLSLIIVQNDSIKFEQYFNGNYSDSLNNVQSVTKSVVSLLVGVALRQKLIDSLNQPIKKFIPEANNSFSVITVENILMMTSGIEWDENLDFLPWIKAGDKIGYVLNKITDNPPGKIFEYNTGATNLLTTVIQRASGKSLKKFAMENLFDQLEITEFDWPGDEMGNLNSGTGLKLSPASLAKIAKLILNDGSIDNKSIADSSFIAETISQKRFLSHKYFDLEDVGYGYLWWTTKILGYDVAIAWGYGGQFIFIIKDLNAAVITTSEWQVNLNFARATELAIFDLMNEIINELASN